MILTGSNKTKYWSCIPVAALAMSQNHMDMIDYTQGFRFDKSDLIRNGDQPLADNKWYAAWIVQAPPGYWDPRKSEHVEDPASVL